MKWNWIVNLTMVYAALNLIAMGIAIGSYFQDKYGLPRVMTIERQVPMLPDADTRLASLNYFCGDTEADGMNIEYLLPQTKRLALSGDCLVLPPHSISINPGTTLDGQNKTTFRSKKRIGKIDFDYQDADTKEWTHFHAEGADMNVSLTPRNSTRLVYPMLSGDISGAKEQPAQ